MSKAVSWTVKGVDPEAREAAKMAARRRDMTIGQWLTQTILSSAAQELKHSNRRNDAAHLQDTSSWNGDPNAPDLVTRSQESRVQRFGTGKDRAQGRSGPPALTPEAILASIKRLASRVEEAETRTAEAIGPLTERIANLDAKIAEIKDHKPVSTAPVERAMMRLNERLEQLEGSRPTEPERSFIGKLFGHS